jgi:Uma2 family endonuclease
MSVAQTIAEVEYPESDGKPVAETDLHLEWMIYIRNVLKYRYRKQRLYVGANLLVYFVCGNPRKSVAPDTFVVKDCDPGPRRTFKTWVEERNPDVVFEVTSSSTRREDEVTKPATYAQLGVKELFLFDPTSDYLDPPLQGYRFSRGRKTRIRPDADGSLECRELGLRLRLEDGELRIYDARTGRPLLTEAEAESAARRAAEVRAIAAEGRASDAEERAAAAEEEARRLREELKRRQGRNS